MGEVTCTSITLHSTVSCYGGNGHKIGTIRGQRKAIGMLVDLWWHFAEGLAGLFIPQEPRIGQSYCNCIVLGLGQQVNCIMHYHNKCTLSQGNRNRYNHINCGQIRDLCLFHDYSCHLVYP